MDGIFYKIKTSEEWRVLVSRTDMVPDYSSKTHTIHLIEKDYVHFREKRWNENKGTTVIPFIAIKKIWYK